MYLVSIKQIICSFNEEPNHRWLSGDWKKTRTIALTFHVVLTTPNQWVNHKRKSTKEIYRLYLCTFCHLASSFASIYLIWSFFRIFFVYIWERFIRTGMHTNGWKESENIMRPNLRATLSICTLIVDRLCESSAWVHMCRCLGIRTPKPIYFDYFEVNWLCRLHRSMKMKLTDRGTAHTLNQRSLYKSNKKERENARIDNGESDGCCVNGCVGLWCNSSTLSVNNARVHCVLSRLHCQLKIDFPSECKSFRFHFRSTTSVFHVVAKPVLSRRTRWQDA